MDLWNGTPYSLPPQGVEELRLRLASLEERMRLLRSTGRLTEATLRGYYGDKRFEMVAESNALEGSTLSVGETELAITKGITITGHDPAYARDAVSLHAAIQHLAELAKVVRPADIPELQQIHARILGERPGAGVFRSQEVFIRGSDHRPPATWRAVMDAMEAWEAWSARAASAPAPIRAAVLHAWLAHVHPYTDGNGRAARAVTNLELIRHGYPPIIIRRKDRDRYTDALAESDRGGDLGPFLDLVLERCDDALRDLERAAKEHEGYDAVAQKIRFGHERQLAIWENAVALLASLVADGLHSVLPPGATLAVHHYRDRMDVDDYQQVLAGQPSGNTWCFRITLDVAGFAPITYLAWTGHRSKALCSASDRVRAAGPALLWSVPNPDRYPQWLLAKDASPAFVQLTVPLPDADRWYCLAASGMCTDLAPSELAQRIAAALVERAIGTTP